jgi:uncharacterized membrane protein YqjE
MGIGSPGGDGFLASLRRLSGSLFELLQVRTELLATELEEEKLRVFDGLVRAAAALVCLALALLMASAFLLLLFWEGHRLLAAGLLALAFAGGAAGLLRSARRAVQSGPEGAFAATRAELAKDLQALQSITDRRP